MRRIGPEGARGSPGDVMVELLHCASCVHLAPIIREMEGLQPTLSTAIHDPRAPNLPTRNPLSLSAVRAMLLGSGELGKEVLIAPQRGFGGKPSRWTVTTTPQVSKWAHHSRTIAMNDPEQLRAPDLAVKSPIWSCPRSKPSLHR